MNFKFVEEWQALRKKREEHEIVKQKMLEDIKKHEEERIRMRELVKIKWRRDLEETRRLEELARRKFFEDYKLNSSQKSRSVCKLKSYLTFYVHHIYFL